MRRNRPSTLSGPGAGAAALGLFLLASAGLASAGSPAQEVKYGVGDWDPESGLGNHRAVVRVEAPPAPAGAKGRAIAKPPAVRVAVPWRRRDLEPEKKAIIVIDAASGERS